MIIKYFAWLKTITNIEEEVLNDSSIKDINSLKKYLSKKYPKMKKHLDNGNLIRVAINLSYTFENDAIKNDDEIALFPSSKWWLMIKIQEKDFNLDEEIENVKKKHSNVGAVSSFIGYVRDINNNKEVISIELEVYEKMAYKSLENISLKAQQKWNLIDSLIIHRFGKLTHQ